MLLHLIHKLVELAQHAAAGLGLGIGLPAFFISRDNADEVGRCSCPLPPVNVILSDVAVRLPMGFE